MKLDVRVCVRKPRTSAARWQVETGESPEALSPAHQTCTPANMREDQSIRKENGRERVMRPSDGGWGAFMGLERGRHNTNWERLQVGRPFAYYLQGPSKK